MKKGNIDEVARRLRISQRRVHGLVAEGVFERPVDGIHDVEECAIRFVLYRFRTDKQWQLDLERQQMQEDLDAGRPIQWTIELAAHEFGVSEAWLRKRLRETGAYFNPAFPATDEPEQPLA